MMVDQEALSTAAVAAASGEAQAPAAPESAPSAVALEGLSEFTFNEDKYTPDQFHKIITERESFAKDAAEYKKEKEFFDNYETDIENVIADPRLAERFKSIYPPKYHAKLDRELKKLSPATAPNSPAQPAPVPREILDQIRRHEERIAFFERREFENATAAASAKIDAIMPKLLEKYPLAFDKEVYMRAEEEINNKRPLNDQVWERLTRESHEGAKKRSDREQSRIMKSQLEKGQRGADSGPGGASPGQAPVKPKTFAEAQAAWMEDVRQKKGIG